jgi:TPP-dependent pyruvate/acetoin dehydrogenase alpha subunit
MTTKTNGGPTDDQLLAMYERMLLVRRMEERLRDDNAAGKLPGPVHLYIGQEACSVGVCAHLDDTDWITGTHRGHGHFLAKGGDPKAMMAEIWAKRTGICQGMGGSMHVADLSKGILGANGIVGGGLAIATGAAFAAKLDGKGRVVVCFFGDGASNQGVFMETMNVASLWGLPVVFLCEHNQFSEFTPAKEVTAGEIADRARAFMPAAVVDGNDVIAVWRAAAEAIGRARSGEGPSFIEAKTYRIRGHMEAEPMLLGGGNYRNDVEIAEWTAKCPVARLKAHLLDPKAATASTVEAIEARVAGIVDDAAAYAEAGEPADPELSFGLMFAGHSA